MTISRSASMYNSPYTYTPPPHPKINYPSLFYSLRTLTCRHLLQSKILAISVLVLGLAVIVVIGMMIAPCWFKLVFNPQQGTFGSEPVLNQLTIDSGIFFLREGEFDNMAFTEKFTNRDALPKIFQAAHYMSVVGAVILVPSFAAGLMLMCRRFASTTALIILAAAVSVTAFCECLVIILCGIMIGISSCDPYDNSGCKYSGNLVWRIMPIYEQYFRVETYVTPYVKPNWAFYVAIIGPILCIVAAVFLWMEVYLTHSSLSKIRYQQMRQGRNPYERDVDPWMSKKYLYQPPTRQGPNTFGMQPVVHAGTYQGTVPAPQKHRDGEYPTHHSVSYRPPSPGFQRKAGPPSDISSAASGAYVSREIDL